MSNLLSLIIYIFRNYPAVEELSKPRLVKLIYLIDWKYCIEFKKQYTEINWFYNHYGPYVDDVITLIRSRDDIFHINSYQNMYGGGYTDKIKLISNQEIELNSDVKQVADFIISNTYHRNWSDFISLIYSTYPIKMNSKYSTLNLVADSAKFRKLQGKD